MAHDGRRDESMQQASEVGTKLARAKEEEEKKKKKKKRLFN